MTAHLSISAIGLLIAKSSLVLIFGWCASRLLHRASAAVRHLVWLTVIIGVLVLPIVSRVAPLPFRILPAVALPPAAATTPVLGGERSPSQALSAPSVEAAQTEAPSRSSFPPISVGRIAMAVWAIVALLLSLRLVVGMLKVGRLARRAVPLVDGSWANALSDAARRIGVRGTPRLVMSDQVEMAFAFDAASPVIILPTSAREWSQDRRRAVLLHELAHIQRRDLLTHAIAGFVCALNWFNPFIWVAARRLRIESEMASDEVVLGAGVRPSAYAQHLLDMVTSVGRRAPSVGLSMARPKEFEGRLVAILDPERRAMSFVRSRRAIIGLVALPAFAIGAVAPLPRAARVVTRPSLEIVARAQPIEPTAATMVPAPRRSATQPKRTRPTANAALSREAVTMLLRFGTRGVMNPMLLLLRDADSLQLTGAQADSIATLNRQHMIESTRIWSPVSAFYVGRASDVAPLPPPPAGDPTRATIAALSEAVSSIDGFLLPEQRSRLSPDVRVYLDPGGLPALVGASPGGVFVSLVLLFCVFGRGRGGG